MTLVLEPPQLGRPSVESLADRAAKKLPLIPPGTRSAIPPPMAESLGPLRKRSARGRPPVCTCAYFVWHEGDGAQWHCYGTKNWCEPKTADPRCVWRGDDYAAGCQVAEARNKGSVSPEEAVDTRMTRVNGHAEAPQSPNAQDQWRLRYQQAIVQRLSWLLGVEAPTFDNLDEGLRELDRLATDAGLKWGGPA